MGEFEDEYSESLETGFLKLDEALLSDTVKLLAPSEPIRLSPEENAKFRKIGAEVAEAKVKELDAA